MKNNICIGPVTPFSFSTVLFVDAFLSCKYKIHSILSAKGYELQFIKDMKSDQKEKYGHLLESDFENAMEKVDTVLLPEYRDGDSMYSGSLDVLEKAMNNHKNVISLLELNRKQYEYYKILSKKMNVIFESYQNDFLPGIQYKEFSKPLHRLHTPVIMIGEMTNDLGADALMASISSFYMKDNRSVSLIGKESILSLLGMHSIDFNNIKGKLERQIYRINKLFHLIELTEHPSVIICKFPHPIMRFNNDIAYDFGASAFMITQAIEPSYFILCSPIGFEDSMFWVPFLKNIEEKFGCQLQFALQIR